MDLFKSFKNALRKTLSAMKTKDDPALRVIDAWQHFEKHGEVCPADWKPGKDGLNPKKASEYFEKANK